MDIADTFFGLILKISKLCLNGYYYPFSICFKFNHANFSLPSKNLVFLLLRVIYLWSNHIKNCSNS